MLAPTSSQAHKFIKIAKFQLSSIKKSSEVSQSIILGYQAEVNAKVGLRPLPLDFTTLELSSATIHERYALAERIEIGFVLEPRVHEDGSPKVRSLGQEEIDLVSVRVRYDAEDVPKLFILKD